MRGAWPDFQNRYHMKDSFKETEGVCQKAQWREGGNSRLSDLSRGRGPQGPSRKCRKQRNRQKRNYSRKSPKSCLKQASAFSFKAPLRQGAAHFTTECDCATAGRNICAFNLITSLAFLYYYAKLRYAFKQKDDMSVQMDGGDSGAKPHFAAEQRTQTSIRPQKAKLWISHHTMKSQPCPWCSAEAPVHASRWVC